MTPDGNGKREVSKGSGMAAGFGIGMVLGFALSNMSLGFPLGVALGFVLEGNNQKRGKKE